MISSTLCAPAFGSANPITAIAIMGRDLIASFPTLACIRFLPKQRETRASARRTNENCAHLETAREDGSTNSLFVYVFASLVRVYSLGSFSPSSEYQKRSPIRADPYPNATTISKNIGTVTA